MRHRLRDRRPAPANSGDRGGGSSRGSDHRGKRRADPGAGDRRARAAWAPAVQLRARDRQREPAGRGAQELPAQLPRILREAAVHPRAELPRARRDLGGPRSSFRHRSDLRRGQPARLHLRDRDLRGFLGAAAAGHARGDGGRDDPHQPVRLARHHRACERPAPALRLQLQPGHVRLCLFGERARREHHRPRVGRAGRDLRAGRADAGKRPLRSRRGTVCDRHRHAADRQQPHPERHFPRCERGRGPTRRLVSPRRLYAQPHAGRCRIEACRTPLSLRARRSRDTERGLLRGGQYPGRCADAADRGDPCEIAHPGHFRRARFDPRAARRVHCVRPARPAAKHDPRLHDARFRHLRPDEEQRDIADGSGCAPITCSVSRATTAAS